MRSKMMLFFLMPVLLLIFVSCGEDEDSSAERSGANGTILNREAMREGFNPRVKIPMIKKTQIQQPNIQKWQVLSTGQTQCYDEVKEIDCATAGVKYAGQDGSTQFGVRSLSLTGNNDVIKDSVTSLLWTKQIKENVNWYEAKLYCDSLKIKVNNSVKNWRLPTTAELRSIVNYGKVGPAIDDVFYRGEDNNFKDSLSNWFWASKHAHFDSETVENGKNKFASSWIINFYDGFVEFTSRYNTYSVRCVADEL